MTPLNPFDVCRCGDYRHEHKNGEGACTLGVLCRPTPCSQFEYSELSTTADQKRRAALSPE